MNTTNQSPEGKTKNITLSLVCAWIFGLAFLLFTITSFSSGNIVSGILLLLATVITLPPISDFLANKTKISLSKSLKVLAVLILFIVGITFQTKDKTETAIVESQTSTSVVSNVATPEPVKTVEYITVTAMTLYSDYKANEVAADAKYKDKYVEVTGTIETIGKDILDTPYVSLKGDTYFGSVQCMFDKADQGKLATLSKDTRITLQGKVSGKLMNIIVRECKVKA